jgi:hypothetical protein
MRAAPIPGRQLIHQDESRKFRRPSSAAGEGQKSRRKHGILHDV